MSNMKIILSAVAISGAAAQDVYKGPTYEPLEPADYDAETIAAHKANFDQREIQKGQEYTHGTDLFQNANCGEGMPGRSFGTGEQKVAVLEPPCRAIFEARSKLHARGAAVYDTAMDCQGENCGTENGVRKNDAECKKCATALTTHLGEITACEATIATKTTHAEALEATEKCDAPAMVFFTAAVAAAGAALF
jgi:hypothetical protein